MPVVRIAHPYNVERDGHRVDLGLSRGGRVVHPTLTPEQVHGHLRQSIPPRLAAVGWQPPRDTRA